MNTPKRVAFYSRVSTVDQKADLQLDGLRKLAEARGWHIVAEYTDLGVSGSKDRRPELDRMMTDTRKGKIDIVACWRFDRFARSVRHIVIALDEFRSLQVDFISLNDGIDTSTPAGRFTFHVIAAVAELERELIRERTKAGVAAARRRGARLGRPVVRVDLDRALELRRGGMSYLAVAKLLGVSAGKLHGALAAIQKSSPISASDEA